MTAREEAERRWPRGFTGRPFAIEHFVQGATWAVEETDERVDAMARAMWEFRGSRPWLEVSDDQRDEWRADARVALDALRQEQGA